MQIPRFLADCLLPQLGKSIDYIFPPITGIGVFKITPQVENRVPIGMNDSIFIGDDKEMLIRPIVNNHNIATH